MIYAAKNPADVLRLSRRANPAARIGDFFALSEMASKDGSDEVLVHHALMALLDAVRRRAGRPVTINSGYRSPTHNRAIGGATNSYHMRGMAADIVVPGKTTAEIAAIARSLGAGGVGVYGNRFVHIDVGPRRDFTGS